MSLLITTAPPNIGPLNVIIGPGVSSLLVILQPDPPKVSFDSFEEYISGNALDSLNDYTSWVGNATASLQVYWAGRYVDRNNYNSILVSDNFEFYTTGSNLTALNAGTGSWAGVYVNHDSPFNVVMMKDTFELYSSGSNLNALNGGSGSNLQAYVVH